VSPVKTESEVLADLQCVIEEGERETGTPMHSGAPTVPGTLAVPPRVAALLPDARLPGLRPRGALPAIDADLRVMELAIRAEELEGRATRLTCWSRFGEIALPPEAAVRQG
jgi:hypothetical protein